MTYHQSDFVEPPQVRSWNSLSREQMRKGIERAGFGGQDTLCQLAWIQPGTSPRPHRHDFEQLVIVIEGTCIFHVEDVGHQCYPGSLLRIPTNAVHWIEVVGDEPVFEIDIFSPVRPDYAHLLDHQRAEWTRKDGAPGTETLE